MKKKDECVFYCKNDKYTLKKQGFCAKAPPVIIHNDLQRRANLRFGA